MFKYALMFIAVLAMSVSFVSCGDDNENEPEPVGNNSSSSEENILDVISKNVKVEVSEYVEWEQTIKVVSQLSSVYPSKNIKYGVEFVFGYFSYEDEDGNEYYPVRVERYTSSISYSSFDVAGSTGNEELVELAAESLVYSEILQHLKNKKSRGETLTGEDQDLYKACIEILNDIHYAILYEYDMECRVFVEIDGKRYIVKTF